MKNLFGVISPKNKVVMSINIVVLTLFIVFGFTSCKDQCKHEVADESQLISKSDLCDCQSNFDIGGGKNYPGGLENSTNYSRNDFLENSKFCYDDLVVNPVYPNQTCDFTDAEIGGGKTSKGGLENHIDIGGKGGKGTSNGGVYVSTAKSESTINTVTRLTIDAKKTIDEAGLAEIGGGKNATPGTGYRTINEHFYESVDQNNFTGLSHGGAIGGKGTSPGTGESDYENDFECDFNDGPLKSKPSPIANFGEFTSSGMNLFF